MAVAAANGKGSNYAITGSIEPARSFFCSLTLQRPVVV